MPVNFEKIGHFSIFFLKTVLINENIKIQDLHMPANETKKLTFRHFAGSPQLYLIFFLRISTAQL